MQRPAKLFLPLLIVYFGIALFCFVAKKNLAALHIDVPVVQLANTFLLILSIISLLFQYNGMQDANPNVFIRRVMGSLLLKMAVCVGAILIYHFLSGGQMNNRAILVSLFLYLVYLVVEVWILMNLNRKKNA
jgi:heme/copper-type cytochrome/quinol oxidase subunit 3